ncbi:hypothetical protein O3P69_010411 [Scylla paramamosain]|uniref:Uncharacterized protein n=1 Tax=Scylla paramamosain TaxID=85552 RepID=A0AAW0TVJ2_SCYPA
MRACWSARYARVTSRQEQTAQHVVRRRTVTRHTRAPRHLLLVSHEHRPRLQTAMLLLPSASTATLGPLHDSVVWPPTISRCSATSLLRQLERRAADLLSHHQHTPPPPSWPREPLTQSDPQLGRHFPSAGRRHRRDGYSQSYPQVVCKSSNSGLFSLFTFAILALDLTGDIMADININHTQCF